MIIGALWLRGWPWVDRLRFAVLLAALFVSDVVDAIRGRHP